jgi:hypothetical protein
MTPKLKQKWREEAKRLKLLDGETQRQIISLHREIASNSMLKKRDREEGLAHADALERHLKQLNTKARKKPK